MLPVPRGGTGVNSRELTQILMALNRVRVTNREGRLGNRSGNQIVTTINFNRPFLVGWSEETLKIMKAIIENIAQCNIIFPDL